MIDRLMLAVRLYAPQDLRIERVPVPLSGEGEVVVKVEAVGICGSDLPRVMKTGTYSYPTIPGHEFAGVVASVGDGVTSVKVGDRITAVPLMPCQQCVYCRAGRYALCEGYGYIGSRTDGAFAEFVKIPAENVLKLPDAVDFETGAMSDPAAVALHAVRKAGVTIGDSVVVLGTGPIGMFAVQWAIIGGASSVVAVDVVEDKLRVARQLGADLCVDASREDPVAVIHRFTSGMGANRVIETAGVKKTQDQACQIAARLGHVVLCGISHTDLPLSELSVDRIMRRELSLVGSWNSGDITVPTPGDWETTLHFMALGKLVAKPMVSHRLSLREAPRVFKELWSGGLKAQKILFTPDHDHDHDHDRDRDQA